MNDRLNERQKREYAALEVKAYGYGGVTAFSQATGLSRETIHTGIRELESGTFPEGDRVRRTGGGRKKASYHQPKLIETIERAANPKTDKRVIVKWTSHSLEHIQEAIGLRGFSSPL